MTKSLIDLIGIVYNFVGITSSFCIEKEVDVEVIKHKFKEILSAPGSKDVKQIYGLITHDCLRQEYLQLENQSFRGLYTIAIRQISGLSSWLHLSANESEAVEITVNVEFIELL